MSLSSWIQTQICTIILYILPHNDTSPVWLATILNQSLIKRQTTLDQDTWVTKFSWP